MALAHVTINSLSLNVPGFARAQELDRLLAKGRMRGPENFRSDGVAGTTFQGAVRDEVVILLPIIVEADSDAAGTPHPVPGLGALEANATAIDTACVEGSASALVPLVLTMEDGTTRTGSVHCPSFEPGELLDDQASTQIFVLEIVIPAGKLT